MKFWIDGTINPTCIRTGIFLFGKPRFVKQVYPQRKKPQKSKWLRIAKKNFPAYFRRHWKKILSLISVEQFRLQLDFGMEDAAATALGTGAVYSIWGLFTAFVQKYISVARAQITVNPVYQKFLFSVQTHCIVKLSLGKAIKVAFDFMKEAYRNERTSYLRTYDHSYAKH